MPWYLWIIWLEVFATSDQSALTIARLLVEQVISRHGVPTELLTEEKHFCQNCWTKYMTSWV